MTPFELIILVIIYTFCIAFSVEIFSAVKCNIFERFLLFLFILIVAPMFTISAIGAFIADIINKTME